MRTLLVKTAATVEPVANADGADGRVKWKERKRLRSRAACPLVRSPASDGRGSSPLERRGAVPVASSDHETLVAPGYRPAPETRAHTLGSE